jgi:hypothetical protein
MDEIWFWMARFFAELFLFVGLVIGLIAVVFVVAIFFAVVNWLREKIKKLKEKEWWQQRRKAFSHQRRSGGIIWKIGRKYSGAQSARPSKEKLKRNFVMDIVERLRSPEVFIMDGPVISPVAFEAAAEIVKLRKVLLTVLEACKDVNSPDRKVRKEIMGLIIAVILSIVDDCEEGEY